MSGQEVKAKDSYPHKDEAEDYDTEQKEDSQKGDGYQSLEIPVAGHTAPHRLISPRVVRVKVVHHPREHPEEALIDHTEDSAEEEVGAGEEEEDDKELSEIGHHLGSPPRLFH